MPMTDDQLYLVMQTKLLNESRHLLAKIMPIFHMQHLVIQGPQRRRRSQPLLPGLRIGITGSVEETEVPGFGELRSGGPFLQMDIGNVQPIERTAAHQTNDFIDHDGKNTVLWPIERLPTT